MIDPVSIDAGGRLGWLRAVAQDGELQSGAYRIAAFIADAYDSKAGCFRYSTDRVARELGCARSTVQEALYALARRG